VSTTEKIIEKIEILMCKIYGMFLIYHMFASFLLWAPAFDAAQVITICHDLRLSAILNMSISEPKTNSTTRVWLFRSNEICCIMMSFGFISLAGLCVGAIVARLGSSTQAEQLMDQSSKTLQS